jgi:cytochrome b6
MPHADRNDGPSSASLLDPLTRLVRAELDRAVVTAAQPLRVIGALALFFFAVLLVTGLLLMMYYQPSVEGAHYSMGVIIDEVRFGWLVRALHAWSSDLILLFALLHLVSVFFARGYAGPAQLTWVTGVLLVVLLLAFGFTGTLLPWDQYAYWEIDAARQTIAAIPVLGGLLLTLFWGGWDLGHEVLLRFYAVHVGILPTVAMVLLGFHLVIVYRTHTTRSTAAAGAQPRAARTVADVLLLLLPVVWLTFGVALTLATLYPPPLFEPANPLAPLAGVQPRWYLLPARYLMRSLSGTSASLVVVALFVLTLLVPVIDRGPATRIRTAARWVVGVGYLVAWIFFALRQYLA